MNIQNVSKSERKATVELSVDDLVIICNALYPQLTENKSKENFLLLYSNMMMVRDLCQYGHVDNFCLHNIVKCRNSVGEGLNGILPDDDIDTFNRYLEINDMPTAFGNTDWNHLYTKIVGDAGANHSEKIMKWMDQEEN